MFELDGAAAGTAAPEPLESYLERERGLRLYSCEFVPEPRAAGGAGAVLVVMHGYGEHCRRYDELARHLTKRGHRVCALDARGHGRSSGPRGHVLRFEQYVEDLTAFVAQVAARHSQPVFLLGHSNGGLIALRAVQRGLAGVRGLVLTSPLLGLRERKKPVPDAVARALSWALPWLPLPNGIQARELTHDLALQAAREGDRWCHGVATPRWYWTATLAGREALAQAEALTVPLLLAQGEQDPIVDPALAVQFYERAGCADKQLSLRRGELHEVLNETARAELYGLVAEFIERRAGA